MRHFVFIIASAFLSHFSAYAVPSPLAKASTANGTAIKWLSCPKGTASTVDCGQIQVPLDHAKPHGQQVPLVFSRARSTSNSTGAPGLYVELGGPGDPNTPVPNQAATAVTTGKGQVDGFAELLSVYDIVGLDVRGTG
ncbi:hypothetical protein H2200_013413 [Cladophialophora chaetospira]|uniref:AB hydrolase-1 domain-containing protein n=1 Tax=Cladophialophora chaetospira TaxID=386627 RepID=A0AA38UEA2_9EURO|nr:hypothetical protein H2200_013413 [Cladophialophora chaetospira]